jgi:hypothetical protein
MGFARLFRPKYARANMGHPSSFVWSFRSGSHAEINPASALRSTFRVADKQQ